METDSKHTYNLHMKHLLYVVTYLYGIGVKCCNVLGELNIKFVLLELYVNESLNYIILNCYVSLST